MDIVSVGVVVVAVVCAVERAVGRAIVVGVVAGVIAVAVVVVSTNELALASPAGSACGFPAPIGRRGCCCCY